MAELSLQKLSFKKEDLLAAASEEEIIFIMLAAVVLQEATFLHKMIIFSAQKPDQTEEGRAAVAQSIYLLRYLGAHLFESWKVALRTSAHKKIYVKLDAKLSTEGLENLRKLEEYFKKTNSLCERLRNEHAYHRPSNHVRNIFRKVNAEEMLEVIIHDSHANCRFTAFEMLIGLSAMQLQNPLEIRKTMDAWVDEVITVAKWFIDLLGEYVAMFFDRVGNLGRQEITLEAPLLSSIWLPYFIVRDVELRPSTSSGQTLGPEADHPSTGSG